MTIDKRAREIAATVNKRYSLYYAEQEAARLGIIEGLEMAAKRVETVRAVFSGADLISREAAIAVLEKRKDNCLPESRSTRRSVVCD
ncbi:MAG: hypothetical protein IPM41_15940 [Sphingomonadales bacterium]|nr:hypothetical protein [Sphingomonadales bacterium]